jgi:hypothetical protein
VALTGAGDQQWPVASAGQWPWLLLAVVAERRLLVRYSESLITPVQIPNKARQMANGKQTSNKPRVKVATRQQLIANSLPSPPAS